MKRMAAVLAAMGALSALVPATAPAASTDRSSQCLVVLMIRLC